MARKFPTLNDEELATVLTGMHDGTIAEIMPTMTGKTMDAIYSMTPRAIQRLGLDAMIHHAARAAIRAEQNPKIRELLLQPRTK